MEEERNEVADDVGRKRGRSSHKLDPPVDYSNTNWAKFIADDSINDPDSRKGKLFRRRFRVPFHIFNFLCRICKLKNVFEIKDESKVIIPIEIKVLICLRILGRDE